MDLKKYHLPFKEILISVNNISHSWNLYSYNIYLTTQTRKTKSYKLCFTQPTALFNFDKIFGFSSNLTSFWNETTKFYCIFMHLNIVYL